MAKARIGGEFGLEEGLAAEPAPMDLDHEAKVSALRDFFAAGKKGDMEAAANAFQTAYDICAASKAEEPLPVE